MSLELVDHCACEHGCPSCIHFPTCGAGNVPLDKAGCIHLLKVLTGRIPIERSTGSTPALDDEPPIFATWEEAAEAAPVPVEQGPRIVVFDLETQRSAAEVGGWDKAHLMRLSLGIVWDSHEQDFRTYFEADVDALMAHLQRADLVVGFNIIGFDYSVLRGYTNFNFQEINTLDMLREIYARLRYRVSLDALSRATLAVPKSADGLQALQWFKAGRLDLLEAYCRKDVELTRDLFQYGLDHGHLLFDRQGQGRLRIPLDWQLATLVQRGKEKGRLGQA
jgi:DEAD/DEAH box helicase domain-containing protein